MGDTSFVPSYTIRRLNCVDLNTTQTLVHIYGEILPAEHRLSGSQAFRVSVWEVPTRHLDKTRVIPTSEIAAAEKWHGINGQRVEDRQPLSQQHASTLVVLR